MLRTRIWVGTVLIALAVGALIADNWLAPWYPFLLVLALTLSLVACYELLQLLPAERRPARRLCLLGVAALILVNWLPALGQRLGSTWSFAFAGAPGALVWYGIAAILAGMVLAAFLVEMVRFRLPGEATNRMALTVWIGAYLGVLPCFLVQLRWLPDIGEQATGRRATAALALTIFVPKCADIGAYFTGRYLGKHRLAPVLSPKKTWEGAAGSLAAAAVAGVLLGRIDPALVPGGWGGAAVFGAVLGIAGLLGDLAESLIKRDCGRKDASQVVPGFGGVLDVVDSIVFAAPVAYWWLT
jgi:phosphatidate cytidylyltransferase